MPVAEQGASTSTASRLPSRNGSRVPSATSSGAGGSRSRAKFSLTCPIRSSAWSAPATQPPGPAWEPWADWEAWAVKETWPVRETKWVSFPPGAAHMSSTLPRSRGAAQAMSSWEEASWT